MDVNVENKLHDKQVTQGREKFFYVKSKATKLVVEASLNTHMRRRSYTV